MLEKWRIYSKKVEVRILRNIKRRNARLRNKTKLEGHQYLSDEKTKRSDPTREIALIRLPNITNYLSSNCFINSFLQIFRHTNIEENFNKGKENIIYQLMERLNNGQSLTQDDINDYRYDITSAFSLNGQEDVGEYCNYVLDTIYQKEAKDINNYQELNFWKSYKFNNRKKQKNN